MSLPQSVEYMVSEAEAARNDADAIREAAKGPQGTWAALEANERELTPKAKVKQEGMTSVTVKSPLY